MKAIQFVLTVNVPDDTDSNKVIEVINDMLSVGQSDASDTLDDKDIELDDPEHVQIASGMSWSIRVKD